MEPVVLFRKDQDNKEEQKICSSYLWTEELRTKCENSLVIGRYSVLPHYKELEDDLENLGSTLINTYRQHKWIANFEYYNVLQRYTPTSWSDTDFYEAPEGEFVVKGKTNSLKYNWNKKMFAENKRRASEIASELSNDSFIGPQGLIYREYVPLETYEYGLYDLPYTNEWRFFFYKHSLLSYGYYWSCADKVDYIIEEDCIKFAHQIANIASKYVNFFVLDIAKTQEGKWILIEINDGQQSGLSENDPETLYRNLKEHLEIEQYLQEV